MTTLRTPLLVVSVSISTGLLGCTTDVPAAPGGETGESEATSTGESEDMEAVLYHEHVRPILAQHCGACHTPGSIGPFALDDYEQARTWGEAIAASMVARTMPPFPVNNDGACNTFTNARWVSDEDIETVVAWVDAQYPIGDDSIPAPPRPEPPRLEGDVSVLSLPAYQPQMSAEHGGFEDYHCFLIDMELDAPRFITGFDVEAGQPQMVHHVLGFRVDPDLLGNGAAMAALDAQSPDVPGWDCFGVAGEDVLPSGVPVKWAPGSGAVSYPAGTGMRIDPGDVVVVQVHYDLASGTDVDETKVLLSLTDEVERQAHQTLWDPFLFSGHFGNPVQLPPGEEAVTYTWDEQMRAMLELDNSPEAAAYDEIEILGLIPHMHQRGRTMSIAFETAAGMQCGAEVDRWDFDWQGTYFLEQPISAAMTDRVHVDCEWSTLGESEPVLPGFGTDDEMCLVGVMFAPR